MKPVRVAAHQLLERLSVPELRVPYERGVGIVNPRSGL